MSVSSVHRAAALLITAVMAVLVPGAAQADSADDHTFLLGSTEFTWNGCRPIGYTTEHLTSTRPGVRLAWYEAVRDIETATGYDLRPATTGPRITVIWGTEQSHPSLAGTVAAYATVPRVSKWGNLTRSRIVLDVETPAWVNLSALFAHELAHTIGLGHTDGPGETMTPNAQNPTWGPGDLAGLAALGAAGACKARR